MDYADNNNAAPSATSAVSVAAALDGARHCLNTGFIGGAEELCWRVLNADPTVMERQVAQDLLKEMGVDISRPLPPRLHIGGTVRYHGWLVMDAVSRPEVDVVGTVTDMKVFPDDFFSVVYASHVFEHLEPHRALPRALQEVYRVLAPGGEFKVSVPDLMILSHCLINPMLNDQGRERIIDMVYGNHENAFDGHKVGFIFSRLERELRQHGFTDIVRVEQHGLFHDASEQRACGMPVSINAVARKPVGPLTDYSSR